MCDHTLKCLYRNVAYPIRWLCVAESKANLNAEDTARVWADLNQVNMNQEWPMVSGYRMA